MLLCRVAQVMAEHMNVPVVRSNMILEGGSVHTDGEGCVLKVCKSRGLWIRCTPS